MYQNLNSWPWSSWITSVKFSLFESFIIYRIRENKKFFIFRILEIDINLLVNDSRRPCNSDIITHPNFNADLHCNLQVYNDNSIMWIHNHLSVLLKVIANFITIFQLTINYDCTSSYIRNKMHEIILIIYWFLTDIATNNSWFYRLHR